MTGESNCPKYGCFSRLLFGLAIAVGPAVGGFFVGKAIENFKRNDRTLTVKGLVERDVKADLAIWPILFKAAGNDLTDVQAKISKDRDFILSFLTKQGFKEEEIELTSSRVTDHQAREYGGSEGVPPSRFLIEAGITVRSQNVDLVKKSNSSSDVLIEAGILLYGDRFQSDPRYYLTKLNDLKPQMLSEATENAKRSAEQIAGNKVGAIRSANQGVFKIMNPDAGENEQYGEEVKSLNKKVRVVSTFIFDLNG